MADDSELFPSGSMELPGEQKRPTPKRSLPIKRIIIPVVVLLGVVVLALVGYKLFAKKPAAPTTNSSDVIESVPDVRPGPTNSDIPAAGETVTFKSSQPRMELTHPKTWTVTENTGGVRIESPEFSYETLGSGEVSGYFRIYIRQGARQADSAIIGRGVASLASEKLTYTAPVTGQRPETNMSFFGLDTDDHFAFLFIAGNFSLNKGESLGPDYGKEPETFLVMGGYSAKDLTDDMATNQVSLEYFQTTEAYKQAIDIIKSLKLL